MCRKEEEIPVAKYEIFKIQFERSQTF